MDSKDWLNYIREIKSNNDEVLSFRNGHWLVKDKNTILLNSIHFFFDSHLDTFQSIAVKVLSEKHPMFDLTPENRFAASVFGKTPKYSTDLRKGIAETLAFLGIHGSKLKNCSEGKRGFVADLTIRDLFKDADWKLWASLNDLLPILAEAAPSEFLSSVKNALRQSPCPFDELFLQESTEGLTSVNYMTGLYWALETLAWNPEHITQSIFVLAELASHDPGGRYVNRPENSIVSILLPWRPQTTASVEKRMASLKGMQREFPEIAWKTLLRLLPRSQQFSSGTHKPTFRNWIPEGLSPEVLLTEYTEQVGIYASMAVEMATRGINYAKELVENLDNLPAPAFNAFLEYLSSKDILEKSEDEKYPIWETLISFIKKHRRFPDATWALPSPLIDSLEQTTKLLSPTNPELLHRILFSNKHFDMWDPEEDWNVKQEKFQIRQTEAIKEIYQVGKTKSVLNFASHVENPIAVGNLFARIVNKEVDRELLPFLLDTSLLFEKQFISGYIWSRYHLLKLNWIEELNVKTWTIEQICLLLTNLPFEIEIWEQAKELLGADVSRYWKSVKVNPFQTQGPMLQAIENLLEYGRPFLALDCVYANKFIKKEFLKQHAIRALFAGISLRENQDTISPHHLTEIIRTLQDDPEVKEEEMVKIEWGYLPLLNEFSPTKPRFLEKHLSNNVDFFVETIQLIYPSKKQPADAEQDDIKKENASNAWKLLYQWKRPPGLRDDGSFSEEELKGWFNEVQTRTLESGHSEVAMNHIGKVLFYVGSDSSGLWIRHSVAELLNLKENDHLRDGFKTEVYNSRGVHVVDPTGKPERDLAELWRKRADDVEKLGFIHFATSLKDIAKSYDREADRITADHETESEEE